MPNSRQVLRKQAEALIFEARSNFSLGSVEIQALVQEARAAASQAVDRVLEADALAQLGGRFAPSFDPPATWRALHHARDIYLANGLGQKAVACQLASAEVLLGLGEERRAITVARQALDQTPLTADVRAYALILIGLCHSHLGEVDLALQVLTREAWPLALQCTNTPRPSQVLWAQGLTGMRLMLWHGHRMLWPGWPGMPAITTPPQTIEQVAELFLQARLQWPAAQPWPYNDLGLQMTLGLGSEPMEPLRQLSKMAGERRLTDPPLAARALYCQGLILRRHGQAEQALLALKRSLEIAEQVQAMSIVRDGNLQVSGVHEEMGHGPEALAAYKRYAELMLRGLLPADDTWPMPGATEQQQTLPGAAPAEAAVRSLEPAYLRRALRFIQSGAGKPMSVRDVADHCGVNRRTLEMAFKEYKAESVNGHIKKHQMKFAADQLLRTDLTVQLVANLIGYQSATAFAREFRKHYGQAPAAWRRDSAAVN